MVQFDLMRINRKDNVKINCSKFNRFNDKCEYRFTKLFVHAKIEANFFITCRKKNAVIFPTFRGCSEAHGTGKEKELSKRKVFKPDH